MYLQGFRSVTGSLSVIKTGFISANFGEAPNAAVTVVFTRRIASKDRLEQS